MSRSEERERHHGQQPLTTGEHGSQSDAVQSLIQAFYRFHEQKKAHHNQDFERNYNEAKLLLLLFRAENSRMRVSELSERMHVSSPFVTQLLNHFESHHIIVRERDSEDRRVVQIMLTDKGRQSAERIISYQHDIFSGLATFLGDEDCAKLAELLHKAFDYLDRKKMEKRG